MSDPDYDAVLADMGRDSDGDNDIAAVMRHFDQKPPAERENLFLGMGKFIGSTVAHAAGNLVDVATGTSPGQGSHAERWAAPFASDDPRNNLTPDQVQMYKRIGHGYDVLAGTGPAASTFKERIPQALEAIGTVVPAIRTAGGVAQKIASAPAPMTAQEILTRTAQNSQQSQGAAAAAPRMTAVSPELQQAVVNTARATGGAVNPEVLNRHVEADSLPVKIQLTPGQASQDPALISREMNNRGRIAGLPEMLDQQNKRLAQNVAAIRDQVGPDVFSTNPVEHGDTLIQSYKAKAAAADAETAAKYQALRDANNGNFPADPKQLMSNTTAALKREMLSSKAPKDVMASLQEAADRGNITLDEFETARTRLAQIARSATDGQERYAAGVMRQEMEKLPIAGNAATLKGLADDARSAARTQFQALEADPAYKAAVNDTVPPDRFVQKFVTGAPRDDVATMRANLAHDPVATQTMGVAALDHLRRAAGIDDLGNGNFSQSGFNKNLQALSPKLKSLVDPSTAEQLETLGNVARYTQFQPRGSYVNNSGTLVGALAEHAAGAAEGIANVKAGGFPVGTLARKVIQKRAESKLAKETMSPYGGMGRLSDLGK